jgi:hypothetical protein
VHNGGIAEIDDYDVYEIGLNLACDPQGTVYGIYEDDNDLYSIDTTTGVRTLFTTLDRLVKSLAFTPDGTLYGVNETSLLIVNLENGSTQVIGPLGIPVDDIAYVPAGYAPPPAGLGDSNCDAHVNLADLRAMTQCMLGSGVLRSDVCVAFDFNHDGRVDLIDFAEFLTAILE